MPKTKNPERPILIVDDEIEFVRGAEMVLLSNGFNHVETCTDPREVPGLIAQKEYEMIMLDLLMPGMSGADLLERIKEESPGTPVVMITAVMDVKTAVDCMRKGAFNYLLKPIDEKQLTAEVRNLAELRALQRVNTLLAEKLLNPSTKPSGAFARFLTRDARMLGLFSYIEAVSVSNQPVLIQGETGTGKELIAESVHRSSGRKGRFVVVNAAGLDDNLFSDTLFGHRKGAFTGAETAREGLIEQAEEGTLFLDEIGDLSAASQVKLLRVLQQQEYMPLGSDSVKKTSARFVCATNQDLQALQGEGKFRKDLYFRLKTHYIRVPALAERRADVPLLFENFIKELSEKSQKPMPAIGPQVFELLERYRFPGNVRELEALAHDAFASAQGGELSADVLLVSLDPAYLDQENAAASAAWNSTAAGNLPTLKAACQQLVEEAMRRSSNNQRMAAEMLGITRQALNQRLKNLREGEDSETEV